MKITNRTLKAKILFLIAVSYSILILILSIANLRDIDMIKLENSDKFYHLFCYALMTMVWFFYLKIKFNTINYKILLILSLAIISYGTIIEILQLSLTTYRQFDWWDVLANSIGVLLGLIIVFIFQRLFNYKKIC